MAELICQVYCYPYKAGMRNGDVLVSVDDLDQQNNAQTVIERLEQRIGSGVKLKIKRAGREQVVDLQIDSRSEANYKIVEMQNPTTEQLKIREAWLKVGQ